MKTNQLAQKHHKLKYALFRFMYSDSYATFELYEVQQFHDVCVRFDVSFPFIWEMLLYFTLSNFLSYFLMQWHIARNYIPYRTAKFILSLFYLSYTAATATYIIPATVESLLFKSNPSERCQHCGNLNPNPPDCFPAEAQMAGSLPQTTFHKQLLCLPERGLQYLTRGAFLCVVVVTIEEVSKDSLVGRNVCRFAAVHTLNTGLRQRQAWPPIRTALIVLDAPGMISGLQKRVIIFLRDRYFSYQCL